MSSDHPLTLPVDLQQAHPGLHLATLPNGLKIIVLENHRAAVAICQVWVRVGSNREPDHLRGWAHGIEHMVFKGTARRGESDFALEVAAAGGSTNAGTGYETTSYHIVLPAKNVPLACDILADALYHASFGEDALAAERPVLVHENHMYDDIPVGFGVTWRWAMELAFDQSPYRYPIGGRDQELLEVPRESIIEFYRAAYHPSNMTVVVVGDITKDEALHWVSEKFGQAHAEPPYALPAPCRESAHDRMRYKLVRGEVQNAYAKLVFTGPSELDPERPALAVVKRLLADGRSCRLYRRVQEEQQLVSQITMLTETGPREGIVIVELETDVERMARALIAVAKELELPKQEPCGADELAKTRIRVERSLLFSGETVQGISANLGYHDAMGDLRGAFDFPARTAAVTADDISRFCRQVFRRGGLSLLVYWPQGVEPDSVGLPVDTAAMDSFLAPYLSDRSADLADSGSEARFTEPAAAEIRDDSPSPATQVGATYGSTTSAGSPAEFEQAVLDSGVRVYYRRDKAIPVVAMGVYAVGGVSFEERHQAGLAALTQQVQVKATARADAESIHHAIESQGASLSPRAERDYGGIFVTALSRKLEPVLGQLGELIRAPSFPEEEVAHEIDLALDSLKAAADDPVQSAGRALRAAVYGSHPYGYPVIGLEESLPGLAREALLRHHRRIWVPRNLQVVVSGDIDPDDLLTRLQTELSDLPTGPAPHRGDLGAIAAPQGARRERIIRDFRQSVIFAAWPGPPNANQDRVALLLLREILNGQSGRLFEALRNRRSLCYNTGVLISSGFGPGLAAAYILTDPASQEAALQAMLAELQQITSETVPAEEFSRAQVKLRGNLLIAHQANAARVGRCALDSLYGRGPNALRVLLEQIGHCSAEMVREAAARYLDIQNRHEVLLGPEAEQA